MNIIKKLIGASALAAMIAISAAQLSAEREPDLGKNFTVSDSPETTVFNLQHPSINRHVHDYREHQPHLRHLHQSTIVRQAWSLTRSISMV